MTRSYSSWPSESDRRHRDEKTRLFLLGKGLSPEKIAAIMIRREATWLRFRALHEEREQVRVDYGEVFTAIHTIVVRYDPLGLVWPGDPPSITDHEYDNEVGTILPQLETAETEADARRIVDEEFCRWFGADVMHQPLRQEQMQGLAEEIWHRLRQSKP